VTAAAPAAVYCAWECAGASSFPARGNGEFGAFFPAAGKMKKSVGRCLLTARSLVFLSNRAIRPLIKKAEHHEDD
jgi:hypothetical protein